MRRTEQAKDCIVITASKLCPMDCPAAFCKTCSKEVEDKTLRASDKASLVLSCLAAALGLINFILSEFVRTKIAAFYHLVRGAAKDKEKKPVDQLDRNASSISVVSY